MVILRFLADEPDYRMNTSLLQDALDSVAHRVSRDVVHADAAWLQDVGLVKNEQLGPVLIIELMPRGLDVASGRTLVPGVKRPMPRG